MKKILKWFVIVGVIIFLLSTLFETEDQAAAREVKEKQEELVAAQVEADKLQAKYEKQAAEQKAEAESKAARDRENATSKAVLVTTCQLAIKPQLKNPKSMDIDYRQTTLGETSDGQLGVKMHYYAENSFGATPLNVAVCLFDADGNLVEYKQAQ